MTATDVEDLVLAPNRRKILELRKSRFASVDLAVAHAKIAGLKLSRQTLYDLEDPSGEAGCRVETLGEILKLYGLPRQALLDLVAEQPDRAGPAPRRKPRAKSRRPRRGTHSA